MKFDELIEKIERAEKREVSEDERDLLRIIWNGCVDCVADEWPVLGGAIRQMKEIPSKECTNKSASHVDNAGV